MNKVQREKFLIDYVMELSLYFQGERAAKEAVAALRIIERALDEDKINLDMIPNLVIPLEGTGVYQCKCGACKNKD